MVTQYPSQQVLLGHNTQSGEPLYWLNKTYRPHAIAYGNHKATLQGVTANIVHQVAEDYNHAQVLYYTPDKQEQEKVQQRLRLPFENIDYYSGTDDSFLDKAFNIFTSRQQYMEDCSMNLWETPLLYVVISGIEHVVKDSENYAKIATLLQFGKAAGIRIFASTNVDDLSSLFPGEIRANIGLRIYCENENTIHFEGGDHNVNSEPITFVPQVQQHLDRVPRSTGFYQSFFCRVLNSIKSVRGEV